MSIVECKRWLSFYFLISYSLDKELGQISNSEPGQLFPINTFACARQEVNGSLPDKSLFRVLFGCLLLWPQMTIQEFKLRHIVSPGLINVHIRFVIDTQLT